MISIFLLYLSTDVNQTYAGDDFQYDQVSLSQETRIANYFNLSEIDPDGDGFIDSDILPQSGDIIYRESDNLTQIEPGQYIVPNNGFYADYDGDNVLDGSQRYAKLVVVTRDNLTYLFEEGTSNLRAVFPNGTGRGGVNTVASVRQVDAFLGEQWGVSMSEQLGYPMNAYGVITIGTSFYISDTEKIPTAQEVHGTPESWKFLLGTEISGGCTRHKNEDIRRIAQALNFGDYILTVETAQDDQFDNALNIYNLTRTAAGLPPVDVPDDILGSNLDNLLTLPENFDPMSTVNLDWERWNWLSFDQLADGGQSIPPISHPATRENYDVIPCGSETAYLSAGFTGMELLTKVEGGYIANFAENITLTDGSTLETSAFYTPDIIDPELIDHELFKYSGGEEIQYFQFAVSKFAWQYAVYLSARDNDNWDLLNASEEEKGVAVNNLSNLQLREVQLVTGLIPGDYHWGRGQITSSPGDYLTTLNNRTYMPGMMNIIYGKPGITYELEFRDNSAYQVSDIEMHMPSPDHDFVRNSGTEAEDIYSLLDSAIKDGKSVVFRVTAYALLTEPVRYETGISSAHYFSLVPQYTSLDEGKVAIYDTMHPSEVLFVNLEDLDGVFSTMTISN